MMLLKDFWWKKEDLPLPDKAKLDRAKPAVKIPAISQGGNPMSTDESVMHIAGAKNAIVWHIFRTYMESSPRSSHAKTVNKRVCTQGEGMWIYTVVVSTPFEIK